MPYFYVFISMIMLLPLGFILGALAIIFILQNNTLVQLSFLGLQFESSLAIVVFIAILSGVLFALLLSLPGAIGNMVHLQSLKKENRKLREYADSISIPPRPQPGQTIQVVEETTVTRSL